MGKISSGAVDYTAGWQQLAALIGIDSEKYIAMPVKLGAVPNTPSGIEAMKTDVCCVRAACIRYRS